MEKVKSTIFVHGQQAHADDMWACALMFAGLGSSHEFKIVRDASRISEAGEHDYVLDCGEKFDGQKYFDHHQLDLNEDTPCAATLVARAFIPWVLTDRVLGPVLALVQFQDNHGPRKTARKYGLSEWKAWYFSTGLLVRRFEKYPEETAAMLAEEIQARAAEVPEEQAFSSWLDDGRFEIVPDPVVTTVVKQSPWLAGFSTRAANSVIEDRAERAEALVSYGFDDRDPEGNQRTLFRTGEGEDAGLDFTKSHPVHLIFAHKGGFILKFLPDSEVEFKHLVSEALPDKK